MACHRRAGKTVACIHEAVVRALRSKMKKPKYGYIGPFRQQAKEIAWPVTCLFCILTSTPVTQHPPIIPSPIISPITHS